MSDEIHLARFGNRGGAHNLLEHTGVSADLLGRILWYTDAPPQSSGVLESFFAGYRVGDAYIVQHTKPDDTAARPGMVLTTAAIIPVASTAHLDLRTLFSRLANLGAELGPPLNAAGERRAGTHVHPAGAAALATAILASDRATWTGPGLADAIGCLWTHLPPVDRSRLVFGAATHPGAIPVPIGRESLVAVAVPGHAIARWNDWPTVSVVSSPPADPTRDAVFGDDAGRAAELAHALGLEHVAFVHWRHLAAAAGLLAQVEDLDHERTRSFLQLLGLLQPAPAVGSSLKQAGLSRLRRVTPQAGFADVRGLRGIPWEAFSREPALRDLLDIWVRATLPDPQRGEDVVNAAVEVGGSEQPDFFDRALAGALKQAAGALVLSAIAPAVLRHPRGADATTWLVSHVVPPVLDRALADAVAEVGFVPQWLEGAAMRHQFAHTHAAVVDVSDPVAAWRSQVSFATRTPDADDALAKRVGEAATVGAAVAISDRLLAERAGDLVAKHPELLEGGDVADEGFRAVWAAAIRRGADPWRVMSPAKAAGPLLAAVARDEPVDEELLDALSRTSAADLSGHPDRANLWERLPAPSVARFLTATAAVMARILGAGQPIPEHPVPAAILAPEVLGAVAHDDAGQAVTILRALPQAGAHHAAMVARRGRFEPVQAEDLAQLVIQRRWRGAAETIADLAGTRPDLRSAGRRVTQLLSPLERVLRFVGISDKGSGLVTADDMRDALQEVAARLYPGGPTETGLWERAGGEEADLQAAGTGRHRWGLALDAVLRGQRGAPRLDDLLMAMTSDYPHNSQLSAVVRGFKERGEK